MPKSPSLVLHPSVAEAIERFRKRPPHATVIVGEPGAGKGSLLKVLAADLLTSTADTADDDAGLFRITGDKHIGIDEVRKIQHFLALKPADKAHATRVICIENAERLTIEAQNALLKSIEEPPADSYLLLTAPSVNQLLPTIMSRVQTLTVHRPDSATLKEHFIGQGHAAKDVDRAFIMSSGLPGAMASLLGGDADHPVLRAADMARSLLGQGKFERLIAIDQLSKDRDAAIRVCEILARMATISLKRDGLAPTQRSRWQTVLETSLTTADMLRLNAQAKLALTALSLKI